MAVDIRWPMPRDLKEADGWRFSSLRKMLLLKGLAVVLRNWRGREYHPASRERAAERIRGVWTQGFWGKSALDPMVTVLDIPLD
jgi:hypothetical protein